MNSRRLSTGILCLAVVMGIASDILLRTPVWGVNALIWVAMFIAALVALTVLRKPSWPSGAKWLGLVLLLFAAGMALRDSPAMRLLSLLGMFICFSVGILKHVSLYVAGVCDYIAASFIAGLNAAFGGFQLFLSDLKPDAETAGAPTGKAISVGRGLAISVPILIVFGALFSSADAVFRNMVSIIIDIDLPSLVAHFFAISISAWLLAGYLRGALCPPVINLPENKLKAPGFLALNIMDVGVPLLLLDLLFLIFVIVQLKYLFGGSASPVNGLSYAEYARSGFFELVAASSLVLPILLAAHWLIRNETAGHLKIFNTLAGVQIVLLFVVMASALRRMHMYQQQFGLTELRFYTTAFMAWLGIVFVWFALTVFTGRRSRFAFGAMVAGLASIILLHTINPDAIIVKTNLARAAAGASFDVKYNFSLSEDSIPPLINGIDGLPQPQRVQLANSLVDHYRYSREPGWRSWSLSRSIARNMFEKNKPRILEISSGTH